MTVVDVMPIGRALISVSDKTGVLDFAQRLNKFDVEIISTGGTAKLLKKHGIPVIEASHFTGYPEMMAGRIKTLHPKIHGGILARRQQDSIEMKKMGISPIDLVVVNLYPFEKIAADPDSSLTEVIENIDIGGPTMLRAAAKNHAEVTAVVSSEDYKVVLDELGSLGGISGHTRTRLAGVAFSHTAHYDGAISNYLTINDDSKYPGILNLQFQKSADLRYGENPHQLAAFYQEHKRSPGTLAAARQIQGKALSFNNLSDADAGLECVSAFEETACVIIKHGNPCGVAISDTPENAYKFAYQTDPTSAFGGIIAFNRTLDEATAQTIVDRQFVELIVAPSVTKFAQKILHSKPNIRVLECAYLKPKGIIQRDFKQLRGGLLIQEHDNEIVQDQDLEIVSRRSPTNEERLDLLFAWKVAKYVKSNAIVLTLNQMTIGVGAGQMSRVYSAKIASLKAKEQKLQVSGCVMASDAFFPFRDAVDTAAEAGIRAIIQPGGSIRDDEIIDAVDSHGMSMIFTRMRHFRH